MKRTEFRRRTPLKNGTPLKRTSVGLATRTRIRARAATPKRWIVARTDLAYRGYVKGFPCDVRGVAGHVCVGPIDPHHVKTRGAGGGDEANLASLCRSAHDELHQIGRHSFARKYGVDLPAVAAGRWNLYLNGAAAA